MLDNMRKTPGRPAVVLISGRDKSKCESIRRTLAAQWRNHQFEWQPSALKTLNYLWQTRDHKPALIVILIVGIDAQQIELLQELAVPHGSAEPPFTLVVADCKRDNILYEFIRLTGGDIVIHIEDLVERLPDIRKLVDDHWFIS